MIDMNVFHGFLQAIKGLPEMAVLENIPDAERVSRAKSVMRKKNGSGAGPRSGSMRQLRLLLGSLPFLSEHAGPQVQSES